MLKPSLLGLGLILMNVSCATAQSPPLADDAPPGWLVKDFADFTGSFAGNWDSDRHVFFAEQAGMDLSEIAPRQHIEITALEPSDETADPHVASFKAVRTVAGGEPIELTHTIAIDKQAETIVQTIAAPGSAPLDCAIHWRREAAQFRGEAKGAGCADMFPRPADGGPLSVTLAHSADELWVTATRGDNTTEARLRRARPFECWTAILRGAKHGDSGEGQSDWDFRRGVTLHDQGGEAELITDEETPRRIRLRLRNVDWPYGTNRPSLTLYVLEGDSDRAVSYAWNEGNAERIGINLRWLQASCTHTPAED